MWVIRVLGIVVRAIDVVPFWPFTRAWTYTRIEGPFRWAFGYPLLFGQVLLYLLIGWGLVGAEFGMSDLFWHHLWWRQFTVGVAVCWLFGVVIFLIYLFHPPRGLPGLPSEMEWRKNWYVSMFPSRNPGVRLVGRRVMYWLVGLLAALYAGKLISVFVAWGTEPVGPRLRDFPHAGLGFLAGYFASFVLAYLLSLLDGWLQFRDKIAEQPWLTKSFQEREPPSVAAPVIVTASPRTAVSMLSVLLLQAEAIEREANLNNVHTMRVLHGMAAFVGFFALLFLAGVVIAAALGYQLPPAVILSLLLIALDIGAGFIAFRVRSSRTFALIAIAGLFVVNSQALVGHKMTYPGIADERYDRGRELDLTSEEGYRALYAPPEHRGVLAGGMLAAAFPQADQIDGSAWLAKYHANWTATRPEGQKQTKPRLVVMAVSGGGVRASVWTGIVLEGLEERFDGRDGRATFRTHVRMFAGASGGMVGAAGYVADFEAGPLPTAPQDSYTGLRPYTEKLAEDSLSPVVQTMLLRDFTWNALVPWRSDTDRGRTLENAWDKNFTGWRNGSPFAKTIRGLRDGPTGEAQCGRPSLVFSPMFVEDSKRLLVSNHDLSALTNPSVYRLDDPDGGVKVGPAPTDLPAVEFFRLFPNADGFRVGTAARMSASFPVVSPAVSLPVTPVRRVVDAGYFDNYGLDVLVHWLLAHRQAIREHTSGVLIVQVRAYPLEKTGRQFKEVPQSPVDAILGSVSAPLQAVLTARGGAAYHRNSELVAALDREFNGRDGLPADFLASATFELDGEAALSWYLTPLQKRQVVEGFYRQDGNTQQWSPRPEVARTLDAMHTWLGSGGR